MDSGILTDLGMVLDYDAENENVKATSVDDFKFGDITLVKVVDGKVKSYITDYTKMKKELGV